MFRTLNVGALAIALCLLAPVHAGSEESGVLRLDRRGMDGAQYFFDVRCRDGRSGDLILNDETNILCAQGLDRPPVCRPSSSAWNLQTAAAEVCS